MFQVIIVLVISKFPFKKWCKTSKNRGIMARNMDQAFKKMLENWDWASWCMKVILSWCFEWEYWSWVHDRHQHGWWPVHHDLQTHASVFPFEWLTITCWGGMTGVIFWSTRHYDNLKFVFLCRFYRFSPFFFAINVD